MPRPRKFSAHAPVADVVRDYANGHSPRVIARARGITRWQATQALHRAGTPIRSREEHKALEFHVEHLPRCAWPGCGSLLPTPGVCPRHQPAAPTPYCGWPRCIQDAYRDGLCFWHAKRVDGAG